MKTINAKRYHLDQIGSSNGINPHRTWYDEIQGIEIYSNDDVLGDKFYMTKGEQWNTIWYSSPTAAAIAFHGLNKRAVTLN